MLFYKYMRSKMDVKKYLSEDGTNSLINKIIKLFSEVFGKVNNKADSKDFNDLKARVEVLEKFVEEQYMDNEDLEELYENS